MTIDKGTDTPSPVAEIVERPISHLRRDTGEPLWQQVNDAFERHGLPSPDWRFRDELVGWLEWARYGERREAEAADAILTLQGELDEARAEVVRLRKALTPSANTKTAYIKNFSFPITLYLGHEEETRQVTVPWTTIKEIMAAIRARAATGKPE